MIRHLPREQHPSEALCGEPMPDHDPIGSHFDRTCKVCGAVKRASTGRATANDRARLAHPSPLLENTVAGPVERHKCRRDPSHAGGLLLRWLWTPYHTGHGCKDTLLERQHRLEMTGYEEILEECADCTKE